MYGLWLLCDVPAYLWKLAHSMSTAHVRTKHATAVHFLGAIITTPAKLAVAHASVRTGAMG